MAASQSVQDDTLLRAAEARRVLGDVSDERLTKLIKSGHLPVVQLPGSGKYRRFRRSDLDRLMAKQDTAA